ncbi:MAG TPA: MsnO8 family LLM class oxidoreductase [Caulobacteraceae bacterium]
MILPLSVLDLSPVSGEGTQAQAVRDTLEVAVAAERLGYRRFWMAEHHSMASISSASPEVLIAALTQRTSRIRLGSGGVMLPNYSPLKVAETFMALEALAPGRIDLGLGRALGADARTGAALRSSSSEVFPHWFALLNAWLLDAAGREPFPSGHPASGVRASPSGPSHPDLFMLSSSVESAIFAGRAGVGMVFAEFIARADGGPAVAAYRQAFTPSAFRARPLAGVATIAFAAASDDEAQRLDAPRRASSLAYLGGQRERFATIAAAQAYLAEHRDDPHLAGVIARAIVGEGAEVRARIAEKIASTGADELFVMSAGPTLETRIASLALIAQEAAGA